MDPIISNNGQQQVVSVQPVPISWQYKRVDTSAGTLAVLEILTLMGTLQFFLLPTDLERFGQDALKIAKQLRSGIVLPPGTKL